MRINVDKLFEMEVNKSNRENLNLKLQKAIQSSLTKFKKNTENTKFSFYFKSNPNVYVVETQVPDLWLKTRKPFNKNECFLYGIAERETKENMYPLTPYVIPDENSLNSKGAHVDKIELDELFGGVKLHSVDPFADDFNINKFSPKAEEKVNKGEKKAETSMSDFYKNMMQENASTLKKKWCLVVSQYKSYGPYTCFEMYSFLQNLLKQFEGEQAVHNFLVCDIESDIYYQPESVLEILENEMKENTLSPNQNRELEKLLNNTSQNNNHTNPSNPINPAQNFRERKLPENPNHLITKYDVFEMNSKFNTAHYLPIKQLKEQLKMIKNKENYSNNRQWGYESNQGRERKLTWNNSNSRDNYFDKKTYGRAMENHQNFNKFNSPQMNMMSKTPKNNQFTKFNFNAGSIYDINKTSAFTEEKEPKTLEMLPDVKLVSIKDQLFD